MLRENIRDIINAYSGPFKDLRKTVLTEVSHQMRRGRLPQIYGSVEVVDEEIAKFLKEVETRARDASKKPCNVRKASRKRNKV